MDPYLEGYLWPDVHQSLAGQFKRQLSPLLTPRYVARLAVYVIGDSVPAHEVGIIYPDVEVIRPKKQPSYRGGTAVAVPALTPPAMIVPTDIPLEVRLTTVHIHDVANNELITAIEILSPANKREPGLSIYREKRIELIGAGVHLLELDLIEILALPCCRGCVQRGCFSEGDFGKRYSRPLSEATGKNTYIIPRAVRSASTPIDYPEARLPLAHEGGNTILVSSRCMQGPA
jgi:hypothetical protein